MGIGFLLVILSAALFGLMPVLAKQIYAMGGNALSLCVYRFLFSFPFLFFAVFRKERAVVRAVGISRKQAGKIAVLSFGCAATPFLLFQSYHYISSGMATTIHFVYPILVLLGSVLIYHVKMTRQKAVCAVLCIAGIISFYTPGESSGLTGVALAFFSGVTYAFYVLYYSKSGLMDMDPCKLSIYLSVFSTVGLLAVTAAMGQLVIRMPLKAWLLTIGFSFMVSVLATVFFQMGTRIVGPEKASLLSTFEPLTSVAAGIIIFHETVTARSVAGIACILCAVVLLALGDRRERRMETRNI